MLDNAVFKLPICAIYNRHTVIFRVQKKVSVLLRILILNEWSLLRVVNWRERPKEGRLKLRVVLPPRDSLAHPLRGENKYNANGFISIPYGTSKFVDTENEIFRSI